MNSRPPTTEAMADAVRATVAFAEDRGYDRSVREALEAIPRCRCGQDNVVSNRLSVTAMMRRLCVFCGSSRGSRSNYADAANRLARAMFEQGIGLVYGGGGIGIMGAIANAMLAYGGEVIGVIPWSLLQREEGHMGLTELHIVDTMHERKALMAELADGFVALPGGIGTLEEFFEIWAWAQLGIHAKPCGLLNESGYFSLLLRFLDHAVEEQFVSESHRAMVIIESDPEVLLQRLASYCPANVPRWLSRDET